ncbi:SERINE/THREONINE PROTEIN PHOSPHATASE 2A PP2A REGULATORY SUBUNIT B [Salix purpurea]|uniref:SERINE/THREONINE PROTEIN PHOSPHATASE 2A PP2A REGULATORY SUBUNIT B n=1 Tax=Salix purpurea TaxID=77065 RepID=A0A9Q0SKM8_SALPP|nr:SERINE/THREONINE PROTEIN PHOSPHATASE 2A PP2A REGULATORY SUBUNIT B [Salix purpurea]
MSGRYSQMLIKTFFDECLVKFEEDEVKQMETREKRELTWKRLEDLATSKAVSNEAVLVTSSVSSISIATGTSPRATAGG